MDIVFTDHAKNRIKKRKISEGEVINAIQNPDKIEEIYGKYYVQKNIRRGKIEVVYERSSVWSLIF